jgi:tetratricopeptide (TPR) repeat protein
LLIAQLELQLGNFDLAWNEAQAAAQSLRKVLAPWLGYQVEYLIGDILRQQGQSRDARAAFRRAIEELEILRTNIHVDEMRMTFLNDKFKVYEALVRSALEIGDPDSLREAYQAVEHAKSRTLVDLMANNITGVIPKPEHESELVEKLRKIREELNWYYTRMNIEELKQPQPSDEKFKALVGEVHKRENQLIKLLRQVSEEPSGYVTLQRVITSGLEEIQRSIPEDAVLIEYYVVDEHVVAFALTHDAFRVFPNVALEGTVRRTFDLLHFQITKFNLGAEYLRQFGDIVLRSAKEHLHQLYLELIAPVKPALQNKRAIIFIPHGVMHYLPFHALFDGERYLIDDYEISYAPSATIYASCLTGDRSSENSALIIGVPDLRAPEILNEVRNIASVLSNATVLIGPEATSMRVRELAGTAGIVHIASHGSFRNDNPMFSSIQLGDSPLSLFDIYNMKTADLVTLSGCGTGMTKIVGGEELVGLVRGFLYSGARSLVVSLWDVYDLTTAAFMKTFYSNLASGQPRWKSLRHAVLTLKETQPHPYYWAPFIGIGAP